MRSKNGTAALGVGAQNGGNREAGKLQINLYHGRDAVDEMIRSDRRFFRRRPDRTYRARLASRLEIEQLDLRQLPIGLRWHVVVKHIGGGARLRLPFPCHEGADTDVSDARCAVIYEAVSAAHGGICGRIETTTRGVL